MPKNFAYINARIRGLKSKLLGPSFFNEALGANDFKAFSTVLSQTPYLQDLEEADSRFSGLKTIDEAVGRNFYRTARSILNFSDGKAGKLIALLLMRYDLNNIKSIARAKHADRKQEEIEAQLLPAGELKPAVLSVVAAAADMAGVAQALASTPTPLRSAFAKAQAKYASDGDLQALELTLDRKYYQIILRSLKTLNPPQKFKRYIQSEVDATNLRTALSLRGKPLNEKLFIKGGSEISQGVFENIISDTSANALQALSGTSFAGVSETDNLSKAEAIIRDVIKKRAENLAADSLNIGLTASYLHAKETESAKIRLLARGKYYQVPQTTLAKELGHG